MYANTKAELLEITEDILKVMRDIELYLKIFKTFLICNHTLTLDYIINRYELRLNPVKIQGIKDTKILKSLREFQRFLDSVNFLKKYISFCVELQELLVKLIKNEVKFDMDDRRVKAFNILEKKK